MIGNRHHVATYRTCRHQFLASRRPAALLVLYIGRFNDGCRIAFIGIVRWARAAAILLLTRY